MSSSKIDHKELEKRLHEDEVSMMFSEGVSKIRHLVNEHGKGVLMAIIATAAIAAAVYFWKQQQEATSASMQAKFGNAAAFVQEQDFQQALQALGVLINDHPDSRLLPAALLLRGDSYAKTGQFDLALKDYQQASQSLAGKDKMIALVGMVQANRSLGKANEALALIQEIEPLATTQDAKDQLHYLRGACHEDLNNAADAMKEYNSIDSKSPWFSLVQERIQWLEAEEVPAIN